MYKLLSLFLITGFVTSMVLIAPQASHAQEGPAAPGSCTNLFANGDMEGDDGWVLDGPMPARFIAEGQNGSKGMLIGPTGDEGDSGLRWSSARQRVAVPASGEPTLSFAYQFASGASADDDQQQVALLDTKGDVIDFLATNLQPTNTWKTFTADMSPYAGQTVSLFFAVSSDGAEGTSRLLVDNVTLCDAASAPQTAAVAAAPTDTEATVAEAATDTDAAASTTDSGVKVALVPVNDADVVRFDQLGVGAQTLRGPLASTAMKFNLPADWKLGDGAVVQLEYVALAADNALGQANQTALDLTFNGTPLKSVTIDRAGAGTATVAIPTAALASATNQHNLSVVLNAGTNASNNEGVSVVLQPTSQLLLPHTETTVLADLALLPYPIVQNSFTTDAATVVVPDTATAADLQAAMNVAAGFGRMSDGKLNITLEPLGSLTDEQRDANHLIFVGDASNFPLLSEVSLPAANNVAPDDGVVQFAASPWNAARTVLVVGGTSDTAVLKAGRAVSSGTLGTSGSPDVAVVSAVQNMVVATSVPVDRTLADLGYESTMLTGTSDQTMTYRFDVPDGQAIGGDAYINLVFNHSPLLNYDRSDVTLMLNGQQIGAVRFDASTTQVSTQRLTIPSTAIHPGNNVLTLKSALVPASGYVGTDQSDFWVTIWPASTLHLLLSPAKGDAGSRFNLNSYPAPFNFDPALSNTALVVAQDDPASWNVAAQVAADLGRSTAPGALDVVTVFGNDIPDDVRNERNLIAVGQPSALPLVAELGEALPAPFAAGSDTTDANVAVSYRVSDDTDVGYLQQVTAPWNAQRVVLTVLGNTTEGVAQAGTALLAPDSFTQATNLAVVYDGRIVTGSVQAQPQVDPAAAASEAAPATTSEPVAQIDTSVSRPEWIPPVIGLALVLMLAIIAFVVLSNRRQRPFAR